jgi:hypothetical protein
MNINKIKVSPEIWVTLYSELSNFILERSSLDSIWTEDENGDEVMTDDKQDEFIDIVDTVETIMRDSGLVKQEVQ